MGGGRERRLIQLIKGLSNNINFELTILTLNNIVDYDEILSLPVKRIVLKSNNHTSILLEIKNIISDVRPDIIHTWSASLGFYISLLKPFFKFKYIAGFIVSAKKERKFSKHYLIEKLSFVMSDIIISNSDAGLDAKGISSKKGRVIVNGFDFSRLENLKSKTTIKKDLQIESSRIVCMIARIDEHKDTKMFIDIACRYKEISKDCTFLVVGKGIHLEKYKHYCNENKIENVILTGYRTDSESIINSSDLAVLCSRPDNCPEGISNFIVESLACSKPVIATSGGGTNEIIVDGHNGYLVKSQDIETAVLKIHELLTDDIKRNTFGLNGKNMITEKFLLKDMVRKYIETYNQLVE